MQEFLTFRKFITPVIIQIIFWLGVAGVIIAGLVTIFGGGGAGGAVSGLLMIVLGPIFVRLYCELIIVGFRMLEALDKIAAK